jgi:small subunit ribosomal protein S16
VVKIRMSRLGRPHKPFYRINAVDSRVKRDGAVIETLGWYDPCAQKGKQIELNGERIKYWISKGAQPSETVADLLVKNSLVDAGPVKARRDARAKASAERQAKLAAGGEKKDEKKA